MDMLLSESNYNVETQNLQDIDENRASVPKMKPYQGKKIKFHNEKPLDKSDSMEFDRAKSEGHGIPGDLSSINNIKSMENLHYQGSVSIKRGSFEKDHNSNEPSEVYGNDKNSKKRVQFPSVEMSRKRGNDLQKSV